MVCRVYTNPGLVGEMRKRKSTRETKNMIQTALWLPRDVHERLKKEGAELEGLGDQIRRRIQMSFGAEDLRRDRITSRLLDEIEQVVVASSIHEPWYANRFAFQMFKAAIDALISSLEPNSEAPSIAVVELQRVYGPDANAETVGRILAGVFISRRPRGDDVEPTRLDWDVEIEENKQR